MEPKIPLSIINLSNIFFWLMGNSNGLYRDSNIDDGSTGNLFLPLCPFPFPIPAFKSRFKSQKFISVDIIVSIIDILFTKS